MRQKLMESNFSTLKSIEKRLDASQQLTPEMQCQIKGGCTNCEDNRRPPRPKDKKDKD